MDVRRVVIGNDSHGVAAIVSDGPNPNTKVFRHPAGLGIARIWSQQADAGLEVPADEPTVDAGPFLPPPGGTTFSVIEYPPDSVVMSPGFDPAAAGEEYVAYSPDMAALMEPDTMHQTQTVDLAVVLSGQIWLDLDNNVETQLNAGDTVVGLGARHAWRNRSAEPARIAFVMVDGAGA